MNDYFNNHLILYKKFVKFERYKRGECNVQTGRLQGTNTLKTRCFLRGFIFYSSISLAAVSMMMLTIITMSVTLI